MGKDNRPKSGSHQALHKYDRQFKCGVCRKEFSSERLYSKHVKTHMHKCRICSAAFKFGVERFLHEYQHQHGQKKACGVCVTSFPCTRSLYKHLRDAHFSTKPCAECGEKFDTISDLNEHMMEHKREKEEREKEKCKSKFPWQICDDDAMTTDLFDIMSNTGELTLEKSTEESCERLSSISTQSFNEELSTDQSGSSKPWTEELWSEPSSSNQNWMQELSKDSKVGRNSLANSHQYEPNQVRKVLPAPEPESLMLDGSNSSELRLEISVTFLDGSILAPNEDAQEATTCNFAL